MATTYQYSPISSGGNFRVLLLHPSPEFDEPIRCSLREIPLNPHHAHPYEALSYVWGAAYGDQEITCDEGVLRVTQNCLTALRYLRLMTRERALWVDSLCIDMSCVAERNQQVKLMGDIYKQAERVLIWLGPGDPAITKLIRRLQLHGSLLSFVHRGKIPSTFSFRFLGKSMDMKPSMRQAFIHLLENDWFKRAWTLQELSIACHPVILCGAIGLEWKLFVFCVRYWASAFSRHVWRAIHSVRSRELYQLWQQETKEQRKRNSSSQQPTSPNRRHSFVADLKRQREQSTLANINGVAFLQLSRFRLATDPRDKIYSLYHMMTDMGVKLRDPDYQISAQYLYEEVTFALIQSSRSLWILENVDSDDRMEGLPSWVPDFSQETSPNELLSDYEHFFEGYSPSTSPGHLILDGKVIHIVKEVAEKMEPPPAKDMAELNLDTAVQRLARWSSLALQPKGDGTAEDAMKNLSANLLHPNFEDEGTATRRQSIMDAGFDGFLDTLRRCYDSNTRLAGPNGGIFSRQQSPDQAFAKCWRTNLPSDSKRLVDQMIRGSLGHRLFVTSNGSFGLCKMDLLPEDLVVLFPGTTAPMFLRGVKDKFQIIGRGSIYGIPKSAWPHRGGDHGLETFTLI